MEKNPTEDPKTPLINRIMSLKEAPLEALKAEYRALFGQDSPCSNNKVFLWRKYTGDELKTEREFSSEPEIRKTLIFAHQIMKLVEDKKISHPRDICPWTNIQETRLDQIMNTLFLSPTIQREILSDNPAISNLTERGIRPLTAITEWDLQTQQWQELLSAAQ